MVWTRAFVSVCCRGRRGFGSHSCRLTGTSTNRKRGSSCWWCSNKSRSFRAQKGKKTNDSLTLGTWNQVRERDRERKGGREERNESDVHLSLLAVTWRISAVDQLERARKSSWRKHGWNTRKKKNDFDRQPIRMRRKKKHLETVSAVSPRSVLSDERVRSHSLTLQAAARASYVRITVGSALSRR